MANTFRQQLKVIRAEQLAAEKLAAENTVEATRACVFSEQGILPAGLYNLSHGAVSLCVNNGVVYQVKENVLGIDGPPEASARKEVEKIVAADGSAMIKSYETRVCSVTGLEFFLTERKDFGKVEFFSARHVYTDAKGIIMPWAKVHARLCGNLPSGEKTAVDAYGRLSDGTYISLPIEVDEDSPVEAPRKFAFEVEPSVSHRRFENLCAQKHTKEIDSAQLAEKAVMVDRIRMKEKWTSLAKIVSGRKNAPAVEIQLSESALEPVSPTKVMGLRDMKAAQRRANKAWKKRQNSARAIKIEAHLETMRVLNEGLAKVRAELRGLKPSTVVEEGSKVYFVEEIQACLERRKYSLLDQLYAEKNAIADLEESL
ncbi:hypothetical protein LCGC14_0479670 [marine sediment metagenome]|uniref:Uncharacterized protein n=1 Tax=marine sediment metagenome TaxID=412755 RepID=A0A0F9UWT3_9ZZZZ